MAVKNGSKNMKNYSGVAGGKSSPRGKPEIKGLRSTKTNTVVKKISTKKSSSSCKKKK